VRVIIKPHIATELEEISRAAGKVTGLDVLKLYQWQPHLGYCGGYLSKNILAKPEYESNVILAPKLALLPLP